MKHARRWYIRGRVQGVGFRRFVVREAEALGLVGHTRNLDDGRVEVYAVGPSAALTEFAGRLWIGPPMSDVRGVEESEAGVEKCAGFLVRG
jgi:acylphosphatase